MTVGRKPTVLAADTRMHVLKFFVLFFKQQWAQVAVFSNSLFAFIFTYAADMAVRMHLPPL